MEVTTSDDALRVALDAQTIRFLQVALATLLVYNCVLSWDDEVEYVWKKRISSTTVLYLILRYFGIAFMVFSSAEFVTNTISAHKFVTRNFPVLNFWFNCFVLGVNQIILQLRLHALCSCSRKILLLSVAGFAVETTTMIVCLTLITISVGDAPVNLGLKINAFPTIAPKIYIHNASMVGYECLLFSVAFYTALRIYQEELGLLQVNWSGVSRLTDILIEGNVVYFFIHMAYSMFSVVVLLTLSAEWVLGVLNVGFSLSVTIGCHIFLQIRRVASSNTLVSVIGEDAPAPSWPSIIFPYLSRRFARRR